MADRRPLELEEGWGEMEKGIDKLIRLLEGEDETQFNAQLYMHLYTTIYNMCTQKPPYDYSEQLYTRYKEAFTGYIHNKVGFGGRDRVHGAARMAGNAAAPRGRGGPSRAHPSVQVRRPQSA